MARIETLIKLCKRKGGDCPCGHDCLAIDEIHNEKLAIMHKIFRLNADLAEFNRKLAFLQHEVCTVRDNWTMPPKPEGEYVASVINLDGWTAHWYSETEKNDCIEFPSTHSWPFIEQVAYSEDWEALGFEVV